MGRKHRKARLHRSQKRTTARRNRPAAARGGPRKPEPGSTERALLGYGFMALSAATALTFITRLDLWVCWGIGVNVTVLIAFSFDKSAAVRNQWRIPEVVLHTLAAAGGSPMTWVARPLFHHKTTKEGFGRTLALITGIQIAIGAGIAYYLSQA